MFLRSINWLVFDGITSKQELKF